MVVTFARLSIEVYLVLNITLPQEEKKKRGKNVSSEHAHMDGVQAVLFCFVFFAFFPPFEQCFYKVMNQVVIASDELEIQNSTHAFNSVNALIPPK